ncbi:MAG: mechanosensitive ion channel [Verrucomicrobiales bacterium]|nr:mechanosensitive ion channel [Verrucomicrobiales bacterium]
MDENTFYLLAQSEALDSIPDTTEEVKQTLLETLGSLWESLLQRSPYLVAGLLVLLITAIIASILSRVTEKVLVKRKLRGSLRQLLVRFVSIVVWFAGLTVTAVIVFPGLDPAKALGGLGLLSVAIGFAFQDIFENFFAGILLLWRFPFENGDFIECNDIRGQVEDVQIRMTQIRQSTGELVVVPNSFLFKNPVVVLTNENSRRIHLTTGIAYGEDVAKAVKVIKDAVEKCKSVDKTKPVEIYPENFGASSVDIDVAWWASSRPGHQRKSRAEILISIKEALDEAGIEIPFPYRTLTFKEPLPMMRAEEM